MNNTNCCECGGGEEVKPERKYIHGHNFINREDRELLKENKKKCKRCNIIKNITDFYKRPDKNIYVSYCNIYSVEMVSEFKDKNPNYEKQYYDKNRERLLIPKRNYRRKTILHSGGIIYRGLNKRIYPENNGCEICGKFQPLNLVYHHWDDLKPENGIWVCMLCHGFVECIDKNIQIDTYLNLKNQIEESRCQE